MDTVTAALVAAGVPAGAVRFTLSLLAAPLLCAAHGALRGAVLRHVVSALLGAAMCVFVFGTDGTASLAPPAAATLAVMALVPRHAGPIVFALAMGYLLWCHMATASGDAWKEGRIDFTGTLMVMTLKLISTAFDVSDGAAPGKSPSQHQLDSRLPRCPSPLAFASYLLYPGTLLAGPWLAFAEHEAFIRRTGVWAPGAKPPPSALPRVLACAAGGLVAVSLHSLLSPKVPEQVFQDPRWVASHSVLYKVLYMWAMGFAARNKYYFVWQWAEAACCAGGVGWAGFETEGPAAGTPRWDRCCNVQVLGVELAGTAAELPLSWNTRTGTWLRHYCYERLLAPPLCAPGFLALLITQAVSGVWHGVYAGYGLFFTGSTFMLHAAKTLYRYQRVLPPMLRAPSVVLHTLLSAFHLNYLAAAFIIVTLPGGIAAWKSVHYVGHISMISICIIGALLPPPRTRRTEAPAGKRQAGAADGVVPERSKRL